LVAIWQVIVVFTAALRTVKVYDFPAPPGPALREQERSLIVNAALARSCTFPSVALPWTFAHPEIGK
jgi:hypothetical protein